MPHRKQSRSEEFIDKVRELDCDEDEPAFEDKLRKMAKLTPRPTEKSSPPNGK